MPPDRRVLMPGIPGESWSTDPRFREEHSAALASGWAVSFLDHDSMVRGDLGRALGGVRGDCGSILYRGWMLPPETYATLYDCLLRLGYHLLTTPEQYVEAHYLPNAYAHLEGHTAESAWVEGRDLDDAWALYQGFRDRDALLKDYAKSAKHRWKEACFLPAGTDRECFDRILRNFLAARGPLFQRGFVFRRFLPLVWKGEDMRGYPIAEEYRLFFYGARLLLRPHSARPDFDEYLPLWTSLAGRFRASFLSMDVAPLSPGGWTVVEVGDGGVTGLPAAIDPIEFYRFLFEFYDYK